MKKTISLLLALCFLAITAVPVFAAQSPWGVEPQRYTCISSPRVSYSEDNSTYTCSGKARVRNSATTTMDLYLQTSYDGGVTYKDTYLLDSKQFTGDGEYSVYGTKKKLSSDCKCRTALYIKVYNSKGQLIDSAGVYSD